MRPSLASQNNRDIIVAIVGDDQVGFAVAVQVAGRNPLGQPPDANGLGDGDATVPPEVSDADRAAVHVGNADLGTSVAVQVADGDLRRRDSGMDWRRSEPAEAGSIGQQAR